MRRFVYILLLMVCWYGGAVNAASTKKPVAQVKDTIVITKATNPPPVKVKKPTVLRKDSSALVLKHFDNGAISRYSKQAEFKYADGVSSGPSWWTLFWRWFWQMVMAEAGKSPLAMVIIKYTFIILFVGGIIYVVLRAVGIDMMTLIRPSSKKTSMPYTESLENIHEIDFDDEVARAIEQHNYRLAVRLLYLRSLKQLSDVGLIQWEIDKTNTAYYYELQDPSHRQAFGTLTRRFEYVWYGNFGIDERSFGEIDKLFIDFKKQLP